MKKNLFILCVLASSLLYHSCKTDLDLIAPYKESAVVYCLINPFDSIHYVRVNRIFLGEGDANVSAAMKDSVYYKPGELSVHIEKYFDNVLKQKIVFTESYEKPLNPGTFNKDQLIYRSKVKFKADSSGKLFTYKLVVKNNNSGTIYSSKTTLIPELGSGTACANLPSFCFFNTNVVSIINSSTLSTAITRVKFGPPQNASICGVSLRFYYTETYATGGKNSKFVDYNLGQKKINPANSAEVVDFSFSGDDFYRNLAQHIPIDPNVNYRMADSINFYIKAGGQELSLYNDINNTSGAFGQEKPIYSNIDNGYGVFSARYTKKITKTYYNCLVAATSQNTHIVSDKSLEALATGPITCKLRFMYCGNSLNYIISAPCP